MTGERRALELTTNYDGTTSVVGQYSYVGGAWIDPREKQARANELIAEAKKAREAEAKARAQLENIVMQLRAEGASWAVIATATGTTKAAAYKRFAGKELR